MGIQPLLICKNCGFITPSGFSFGGKASHVSVVDCIQVCNGCRKPLAHPDMFINGGSVHLVNRDPEVVAILANVVEAVRRGDQITITEVEYHKLPLWARKLIDSVRHNAALTVIVIPILIWMINRGMDIAEIRTEKNLELRNAIEIQDREFEHDRKMQSAEHDFQREILGSKPEQVSKAVVGKQLDDIQDGLELNDSDRHKLCPLSSVIDSIQNYFKGKVPKYWSDALEKLRINLNAVVALRAGTEVTREELVQMVRGYNEALASIYKLVQDNLQKPPFVFITPSLPDYSQVEYVAPNISAAFYVEFIRGSGQQTSLPNSKNESDLM